VLIGFMQLARKLPKAHLSLRIFLERQILEAMKKNSYGSISTFERVQIPHGVILIVF
jgi:hypothetical protein